MTRTKNIVTDSGRAFRSTDRDTRAAPLRKPVDAKKLRADARKRSRRDASPSPERESEASSGEEDDDDDDERKDAGSESGSGSDSDSDASDSDASATPPRAQATAAAAKAKSKPEKTKKKKRSAASADDAPMPQRPTATKTLESILRIKPDVQPKSALSDDDDGADGQSNKKKKAKRHAPSPYAKMRRAQRQAYHALYDSKNATAWPPASAPAIAKATFRALAKEVLAADGFATVPRLPADVIRACAEQALWFNAPAMLEDARDNTVAAKAHPFADDAQAQDAVCRATMRPSSLEWATKQFWRATDPSGVDTAGEFDAHMADTMADEGHKAREAKATAAREAAAQKRVDEKRLAALLAADRTAAGLTPRERREALQREHDGLNAKLERLRTRLAAKRVALENRHKAVGVDAARVIALKATLADLKGDGAGSIASATRTLADLEARLPELRAAVDAAKQRTRADDAEVEAAKRARKECIAEIAATRHKIAMRKKRAAQIEKRIPELTGTQADEHTHALNKLEATIAALEATIANTQKSRDLATKELRASA